MDGLREQTVAVSRFGDFCQGLNLFLRSVQKDDGKYVNREKENFRNQTSNPLVVGMKALVKGETRTITLVEQSDAELVRLTLCGNNQAYNSLVQRYQRQVYNLAYRMLGNAEDAGDLVQETFLRAYNALGTFRQDASFLTWLYKIASNLCIDQLRSRKAKGALSLDVELAEGREPAADLRANGPEEMAIRDSVQDVVQHAIKNLPERYRVVVVMRHLQDMSVDEIARALNMPTGTVKTHLFRAREMLRERLRPVLEVETDGK